MHNIKKDYGIWGEFFYEIVDEKTKKVLVKSQKKKNLILNQGLDFLALRSFVENVAYCAVGTSTTAPLYTDTGLVGEFDRTGNLDTSLQVSASTSLSGNTYSFTRVFKLDSSVNPAYYGTVGWSYSGTAGNNLFSKSLILTASGGAGPVQVLQGQYMRIHYTINVIITPTSSTNGNSNITNLPATDGGNYNIQLIGLRSINSQNVLGYWDAANDANELNSQVEIFLSTSSAALSSFGSATNRSGSTNYVTKSTNIYSGSGTGIMKKFGSFGKNTAVNGINSMGTGAIGSSTTNTAFAYVFTNTQNKAANFIMAPAFLYSITRM